MPIFVIGMHRSGTSMVASILQSLGVNLGPDEEMVPANQFNEAGYFENAPAVSVNDTFLKKNDLSWRTLPAIESRSAMSGVDEYVQSIEDVVKRLDQNRPWALKDPRLSFLLPYWKTSIKPMSAVICLRRPDAAALSLKTRNDLSISYAAALWELYTLAALRNTRRMTRALVVYEDLLANPKQTIEKLIAALPELGQLNPDTTAIKAAAERVRRDLDHSKPVNSKVMPPAVLELYERLAAGDLTISKNDAEHGVAFELVRLEAGHQAAKRLNGEARELLARANAELASEKAAVKRHAERLGDLVSLVAEPGEKTPDNTEAMLDRLRQAVRNMPGTGQKSHSDAASRELLRAKDERIEWLRQELGATGARNQTILDQTTALEIEVARLRAEHEQHGLITASNHREILRLSGEVQRLNELLNQAEEDRAKLELERTRIKAEYEIALSKLNAEREIVADAITNLRTRLNEKERLVSQIQAERLEEEITLSGLRRIASERETLIADLSRATETLEQRNKELADLAARERNLSQRAYKLDGEIEQLQRDILHSRLREADLSSALTARDQSEAILRAAATQQNAVTSEIQLQLAAARETISSLEQTIARRIEHSEELEARYVANRRQLIEYEVRMPMLEAVAAERNEIANKNTELKLEIQRIIAERDQALEKQRQGAASLEKQIADLNRQMSELNASARRAIKERDQALAAITERDAAIRERDAMIVNLMSAAAERDEARAALAEKDAALEDLKSSASEQQRYAETLRERDATIASLRESAEALEVARNKLRDREAIIENLKKMVAAHDETRALLLERNAQVEKLKQMVAESGDKQTARGATNNARSSALEAQVADLNRQLAEMTADYAASHAEAANAVRQAADLRPALDAAKAEAERATARAKAAEAQLARLEGNMDALSSERPDDARREAADLRAQLAAAKAHADAIASEGSRIKAEHDELARALQSARARAEQLKSELTSKTNGSTNGAAQPAPDQRLRRQLLVLNELLSAIDSLLSPKYGRFTIPVRQIRVRLSQARQVLDGEVAMTRR